LVLDKFYFIAGVLDVTGRLGGYNFQRAFSSGAVCGDYIKKNQRIKIVSYFTFNLG